MYKRTSITITLFCQWLPCSGAHHRRAPWVSGRTGLCDGGGKPRARHDLHESEPGNQHTVIGEALSNICKGHEGRSGPEPQLRQLPKGLYSYPDLLVACGEMQFHDEYRGCSIQRWSSKRS